ncbi:MAG: methyltransferase domain-containing protein [Ignavibacteriaceae bacterium]
MKDNAAWSENIIKKIDPKFQHRWIAYNAIIKKTITKETIWIDAGCGNDLTYNELRANAKLTIGADLQKSIHKTNASFVLSNIRNLPFKSNSVQLVTLRFVVEHLKIIPADLLDVERILDKNGKLIILTTNALSPIILFPRILPFGIKNFLISKIFNEKTDDIFPTFHRFNTKKKMLKGIAVLRLKEIYFLQDANYTHKTIFLIYFLFHLFTKPKPFQQFRSNILAVFQKVY